MSTIHRITPSNPPQFPCWLLCKVYPNPFELSNCVHYHWEHIEEDRWAGELPRLVAEGRMCIPYWSPDSPSPPADEPDAPKPDGVALIAAERARQISEEGWTPEHDDDHDKNEMAIAADCYALPHGKHRREEIRYIEMDAARGCADPAIPYRVKTRTPCRWPWDPEWWRPTPKNRIRELVKAGALIAAEIDRLQRKDSNEHR